MPIRGETTARLTDGRALTLKVNFATLARAAAQTGIAAEQLLHVIGDKDDPRQMLALLAMLEQGLRRHHPQIDEDAVGDLMLVERDAQALSQAVLTAAEGAFGGEPDPAADAGDRDGANPPGTSTRSSGRGPKPVRTRGSSGSKRPAAT